MIYTAFSDLFQPFITFRYFTKYHYHVLLHLSFTFSYLNIYFNYSITLS